MASSTSQDKDKTAHAPGFFAKDVAKMLQQRAEWMESLPTGCLLTGARRSDDALSDESDHWDGKEEEAGPPVTKKESEPASILKAAGVIDSTPLCFAESQKRFAGSKFFEEVVEPRRDLSSEGAVQPSVNGRPGPNRRGSKASVQTNQTAQTQKSGQATRVEPPARRLQRVRFEVQALCDWAENRRKAKTPEQAAAADASKEGEAVQEATRLGSDLGDLAGLVQRAAASHRAQLAPDVASKQIWLPPQERDEVAMVQQLVHMARLSNQEAGVSSANSQSQGHQSQISYKFSAALGGGGGGWLGAAEAEALGELEGRMQQLSVAITGSSSCEGKREESLGSTAAKLHRRLDILQRVQDEGSCEQLRTVLRLLSAEVNVAIVEAKHLEALEAEDIGDDALNGEDDVPQQIARLHAQVDGLSSVFARVVDLDQQLDAQGPLWGQLARFASDLAGAEAQAQRAHELLRAAAEAAVQMQDASQATRKQLERNVATLESRLEEWQTQARANAEASAEGIHNDSQDSIGLAT